MAKSGRAGCKADISDFLTQAAVAPATASRQRAAGRARCARQSANSGGIRRASISSALARRGGTSSGERHGLRRTISILRGRMVPLSDRAPRRGRGRCRWRKEGGHRIWRSGQLAREAEGASAGPWLLPSGAVARWRKGESWPRSGSRTRGRLAGGGNTGGGEAGRLRGRRVLHCPCCHCRSPPCASGQALRSQCDAMILGVPSMRDGCGWARCANALLPRRVGTGGAASTHTRSRALLSGGRAAKPGSSVRCRCDTAAAACNHCTAEMPRFRKPKLAARLPPCCRPHWRQAADAAILGAVGYRSSALGGSVVE